MRTAVATTSLCVLATALAGAPAAAAPKPPRCPLILDAAGDATFREVHGGALDILSGDVAVSTRTTMAVLRLGAPVRTDGTAAALGHVWQLSARRAGVLHTFRLTAVANQGPVAEYVAGGVADKVAVNIDGSMIVWVVPTRGPARAAFTEGTAGTHLTRAGGISDTATGNGRHAGCPPRG